MTGAPNVDDVGAMPIEPFAFSAKGNTHGTNSRAAECVWAGSLTQAIFLKELMALRDVVDVDAISETIKVSLFNATWVARTRKMLNDIVRVRRTSVCS